MKNSILLLASLFLLSCSSDKIQMDGCNCGTITNVVVVGTVMEKTLRIYTVKNDCNGLIKEMRSTSIVSKVGEKICD